MTLSYTDTFADHHNLDIMFGGEYFNHHEFLFDATTEDSLDRREAGQDG